MRELCLVAMLMVACLLSGCGHESTVGSGNAATIDCAIEIQIAVLNSALKAGQSINEGDWRVASACVIPVHSTGGLGTVISNTDGTIIQIEWSAVRMFDNGNGIVFDDFDWSIANRIDRRDGVSHFLSSFSSDKRVTTTLKQTKHFGTEFDWLCALKVDTTSEQKTDRRLVIRGRFIPKARPAAPLNLAELTERSP